MKINKFQKTNSPCFNAMLRIKRPVNVKRLADGKELVSQTNEALIDPEKIESILPIRARWGENTGQILIYTKDLCYEIIAQDNKNTLENLYAACAKARSLGAEAKAVEFDVTT